MLTSAKALLLPPQGYIKIDLKIKPDGWCLTLFGQNIRDQAALVQAVEQSNAFIDKKPTLKGDRYVLEHWILDADYEKILTATKDWVVKVYPLVKDLG